MTNEEINRNISDNLLDIIDEKKINKADFVDEIKKNTSLKSPMIYDMIRGYKKSKSGEYTSFGIDKISSLCNYLGISIDGLISSDKPLTTDPKIQAVCKYTGLNEEAVKELNKLKKTFKPDSICSETISQFLFGFLDKIIRYQSYAIDELENLISLKIDINDKIDSIRNVNSIDWFFQPENEPMTLNNKFNEYILPRKAAKFDIQEFTLDYVNKIDTPSIETDHIKIENSITSLLAYYYGYFDEKREEMQGGDNHGEHNQND